VLLETELVLSRGPKLDVVSVVMLAQEWVVMLVAVSAELLAGMLVAVMGSKLDSELGLE